MSDERHETNLPNPWMQLFGMTALVALHAYQQQQEQLATETRIKAIYAHFQETVEQLLKMPYPDALIVTSDLVVGLNPEEWRVFEFILKERADANGKALLSRARSLRN